MMFKRRFIPLILSGRKTSTIRRRRPRKRIQAVFDGHRVHGYIEITGVRATRLRDLTDEDVRRDGFRDLEEFRKFWVKMNGGWNPDKTVYIVSFRPVKQKIREV